MAITVRLTQADKDALPWRGMRTALICLLKERGLILHDLDDAEGTLTWWDPSEEPGVTIYQQTIPRKKKENVLVPFNPLTHSHRLLSWPHACEYALRALLVRRLESRM